MDLDAKLDTGMMVREAIKQASRWWDKSARHRFVAQASSPRGFSSNDPDHPNALASGIMRGLEWDLLTKDEKLRIVKAWHHFHVRRPDRLGIDPEEKWLMGQKEG